MDQVSKINLAVLSTLLFFVANASHGEIVVIVNSALTIDSLTKEQVADIFLDKNHLFPNNEKTNPVTPLPSAALYSEFANKMLGRNDSQLRAHWSRLIFTGMGKPPTEMTSVDNIKDYVADNENGIGYIYASDLSSEESEFKIVFKLE
jgi:ABC-type phosphate transport system substrate-binding protein